MLYLEDYLEMIEHLPQELRDRFTTMREMDLQVQNTLESLEKRVKIFFSNATVMNGGDKQTEYTDIKKNYSKIIEDADEKVQLANNMHELVSMYLRRLDEECHKFKMELEADNAGITEILEKRSEEMDVSSSNSSQKENRYSVVLSKPSVPSVHEKKRDALIPDYKRLLTVEKVLSDARPVIPMSQPSVTQSTTAPATVGYGLGQMSMGRGNVIAAAATRAIAATQQMQHGRRTASLKASYEAAISGGMPVTHTHDLGISKELAGAARTAIAAIQDTSKKLKKKSSTSTASLQMSMNVQVPVPTESSPTSQTDVSNDPNEPRYCICNEVAYGGMVACDNKHCPYEWFHYPCVGITDPPKGSWYCPQCLAAKKRKVSRKKKHHPMPEDRI